MGNCDCNTFRCCGYICMINIDLWHLCKSSPFWQHYRFSKAFVYKTKSAVRERHFKSSVCASWVCVNKWGFFKRFFSTIVKCNYKRIQFKRFRLIVFRITCIQRRQKKKLQNLEYKQSFVQSIGQSKKILLKIHTVYFYFY